MLPTVTVIIPAYNQARFVRQAIDSVLAQDFTDYEIIVINDGSTDETPRILASYGDHIRLITQANAGLSAARNSGLRLAKGKIIGFLDADDMWYPNTLSTLISFLRQHPEIDIVCGAWDLVDETGSPLRQPNEFSAIRGRIRNDFLRTIAVGNFVIPSALAIRRKCFECCGFFDETLKGVEDWDLLVRMAAHSHQIELLDTPVLHYRRHESCLTRDPKRTEQASRQALNKMFADQGVVAHLTTELKEHAYVYAWLSIAGYCHEAGLEADRHRFIQMAEQHYRQSSPNLELSLNYLNRLSQLPDTEDFMQLITKSMPEMQPLYYWLMARRSFQAKQYSIAALNLIKLIFNQPMWFVRKILLGIGLRLLSAKRYSALNKLMNQGY